VEYDPILAKLVVHAEDREAAIARMRRALAEFVILGVKTPIAYLRDVLASEPRGLPGRCDLYRLYPPAYGRLEGSGTGQGTGGHRFRGRGDDPGGCHRQRYRNVVRSTIAADALADTGELADVGPHRIVPGSIARKPLPARR
jgi:hypothetical protein